MSLQKIYEERYPRSTDSANSTATQTLPQEEPQTGSSTAISSQSPQRQLSALQRQCDEQSERCSAIQRRSIALEEDVVKWKQQYLDEHRRRIKCEQVFYRALVVLGIVSALLVSLIYVLVACLT